MSEGPRPRALLEVCVADVDGAIAARDGGADRLELCADLASGGATPSLGMVAATLDGVPGVPVRVMIRPVGGRFALDDSLLDVMLRDLAAIRALAPTPSRLGFVLGALRPDDRLDEARLALL